MQALMNTQQLMDTANALVADDKGLLAMDESNATCNQRFAALGIPLTPEMRRQWRDLIVTAPGLGDSVSGAILFDETIRQQTSNAKPFAQALADAGILPGIKVDTGAKALALHPGEKVTEGLDGLRERLAEYAGMGARFAKWRAVITIGEGIPGEACIQANAHALARYAALCQEAGLVPIVEPEVLMDGDHTLQRCAQVSEQVLRAVFEQLTTEGVLLEGMLLKPAMVVPGTASADPVSVDEVADATVRSFLRAVPAAVAGVAFLSGGQSGQLASARLNAMNLHFRSRLPWPLTFSFSRAIQYPALAIWHGLRAHVTDAQEALVHRAACNRAARRGQYDAAQDRQATPQGATQRQENDGGEVPRARS
jgi:fructose-bisphosphate aldolase class I